MNMNVAETASARVWSEERLNDFVTALDKQIRTLVERIERTHMWKVVMSPSTPAGLLRAILREVHLEIYSYQPQVIEATIATIGRMPKTDPKMIQRMLIHQAEEADHGEMALRDYVALGGDEQRARTHPISPASFAVASLWWGLWRMADPFCYLGALYPFEGLTPIVCQRVRQSLQANGFPGGALEYINFHATEDIKHANLVRKLLKYVVKTYPTAADSIMLGIDYFLAVYPLPVWQTAYHRACAAFQKADLGSDSTTASGPVAMLIPISAGKVSRFFNLSCLEGKPEGSRDETLAQAIERCHRL
jgi:pyrroloquinoline quinone (PQQ) biosynthesis protein C